MHFFNPVHYIAASIFSLIFTFVWLFLFGLSIKKKIFPVENILAIPSGFFFVSLSHKMGFHHSFGGLLSLFIFMSSLSACAICDIKELFIPRLCSIWITPFWCLFAYLGLLNICFFESLSGATIGYSIPWSAAKVFKIIRKKDGMGKGDMELMSMVGAFMGVWASIMTLNIACIMAIIWISLNKMFSQPRYDLFNKKTPFAPFISISSMLVFFFVDLL